MANGFLSEDDGATLVCDDCGQTVRSNEEHRCAGRVTEHGQCYEPRAERVEALISGYQGDDDLPSNVIDVLTDLRHLCAERAIDFADAVRISEYHFEAEREGSESE